MGKFINTTYRDSIESITGFQDKLLQNPFIKFNDKSPTPVRYWNTNIEKSTLDPGSGLQQIEVGEESPTRFNVIEGLMIYGLPKMELELENGDFGLEASPITGEAYIMPNTIIPYDGDFFEIPYMYDKPWLFMVNKVDRDTFETGANVYKITYHLERHEDKEIKKNVVDEFIVLDVQEGTNIKAVVKKKNYIEAEELENLASTLKSYYQDLFFIDSVQTFIYKYLNESNVYDPFMIEFLIRNQILKGSASEYVYVSHQMPIPATFAIDYDKTFYRAFELKDKDMLSTSIISSQASIIDCMASIFHTRFEPYFALEYKKVPFVGINLKDEIKIIPQDLVYSIIDNKPNINLEPRYQYQNLFVKFFNDTDITQEDIANIKNITYDNAKEMFYMLPLLIFVIESYTQKLLS